MSQGRVLVVEDEAVVGLHIRQALEQAGYEVCAVLSSGEEAVDRLPELRPDVVLMDMVLRGGLTGADAAERMAAVSDVPVVYLTAHSDDQTIERLRCTAPFGFLSKPFDERELCMAVAIALERHQLERRVRESEAWLELTLRCISDAVVATDEKGRVRFVNPVAEGLAGRPIASGEPVADGHPFEWVHEQLGTAIPDPIVGARRSGRTVPLPWRAALRRSDGLLPVEGAAAPLRDTRGGIIGAVLVFRDMSRHRQAEEEIFKAEKLSSIGRLAGGIAHDFNNILTLILGNVSQARAARAEGEDVDAMLQEAEKGCERARNLTQQLLTFAEGGAPIRRAMALDALLRDTALFALSGSRTRCVFEIPDDLRRAEVDEAQLARVVTNLVLNAAQATAPGADGIRVGARNVDRPPSDDGGPVGPCVEFFVQDHGAGISREHMRKIFDPYFTTKPKGVGLGLTASYSIVRRHGGRIEVESREGEGTTVRVILPAVAADKEKPDALPAARTAARVLVMDDEPGVRAVMARLLSRLGYEAECAEDGARAIELFDRNWNEGRKFDVVIMDLTVPGGMGGAEAVRELRRRHPEVRAIVSSGYSNDPIMAQFRDHGFSAVLLKPFTMEELRDAVRRVMA